MIDDTSSDDDIIDERIRALAAGHFNAPAGDPPRDAMWEGIAAARRAARASGAAASNAETTHAPIAPTTISITPLIERRSHAAAWRWGAALAAGLILGIVVDRRMAHESSSSAIPPVAVAPSNASPRDTATRPLTPDTQRNPVPVSDQSVAQAPKSVTPRTPSILDRSSPSTMNARPLASRAPLDSAARSLYRVAATQTLVQAEALLTAYRADQSSRDPQVMLQAARWARDVLSSTRLLIDSPAGRDPQMRALLSDLELILAQLVQLSGTPLDANERDLIERAMRERDLLPRLRSAVPAGLATS